MKSLEHSPCPAFISQFQNLNLHFPQVCSQKLSFYPIVQTVDWFLKYCQWGVKTIQLRVKNKSYKDIMALAKECQKIANEYQCQFFLNDYWEIACELNVYGLHLGFEDLQTAPLKIINKHGIRLGLSTHSYFELATALSINPSYIALGPIYETTLKKMRFVPQGLTRITTWRSHIPQSIPLVAIGGISLDKKHLIYDAGANSIAVISDIQNHSEPEQRTYEWLKQ